jgi:hypothetical protein
VAQNREWWRKSHKHGNEIPGPIKRGLFLDQLSDYQLIKTPLFYRVNNIFMRSAFYLRTPHRHVWTLER